jgi:hypothetical protein
MDYYPHPKINDPTAESVANRCVYFILDTGEVEETLYTVGKKDICTVFFYSLAWIVVHAIVQEYILDVRKFSIYVPGATQFFFAFCLLTLFVQLMFSLENQPQVPLVQDKN